MRSFQYYHKKLDDFFQHYGMFIANRPWTVILLSLIINGMLGMHITRLKFESDMEKLYYPTNSEAVRDREKVKSLFPDQSRSHFYPEKNTDHVRYVSVIAMPRSKENILESYYHVEILRLHHFILNATTLRGSKTFNYTDLCAKRNGDCFVDGSFLLENDFWLEGNSTGCNIKNCSMSGLEDFEYNIGGIQTINDSLISAKAIKLTYFLRSDDPFNDISIQWERDFIKTFKNYNNDDLDVTFSRSDSLNNEINDNAVDDIKLFSLTFTMMISYTSFVTSSGNCVSQRVWLGRAGVISSGLSIMACFGFSTFVGVDFINIIGVMPFLILGLGINGTLVLLSGLADAPLNLDVDKRIGITLRHSGMAMTTSSLCIMTVFSTGMKSSFMVIRNFCFYSVFAVLFWYLNMMTFFVACMSIHEKRVASSRHCCTCQEIKSRDDMRKTGHSCCKAYCCGGSMAEWRHEQESTFEKVPRHLLPKTVLFPPLKIVVIISFISLLGFSTLGSLHFQQGYVEQDLLSRNSYYLTYLNANDKYFKNTMLFSAIFVGNISYSTKEVFLSMQDLKTTLKSDFMVDDSFEIDWYSAFYNYLETNLNLTENDFTHILKNNFLPRNDKYKNDIVFNEEAKIKASRIYLKTKNIKDSHEKGLLMQRLRKVSEQSNINVLIYSPRFIYFEQFTQILRQTFYIVGIGLAVVFLLSCLFLLYPLLVLCINVSIALTLLGLFGFMSFWDIPLTPITTLYIVTGIGFSIDFSVHVCNAYKSIDGRNKNERVYEAIVRAGVPVFNCSMTALIGILMSLLTKSYAFLTFFKVMLLIVIFSFGHSLFLIPVVLSVIGQSQTTTFKKDSIQKDERQLNYKDNFGFQVSDIYSIKM